jgi:hypothetical protein
MKTSFNILMVILLALVVTGCEKPETPVTLPPATGRLFSVQMGSTYASQVYVSLESGIVKSFPNETWDLAFDCGNDNFIQINGGNTALIAYANTTDFSDNIDYKNQQWHWDAANGMNDSLALSHWELRNDSIFLIDRGQQYAESERYFQFRIKQNGQAYELTVANHKGSLAGSHTITKDASKNLVYFSFANGGEYKNIEPDKTAWDICFLKYRWIYYEFNPPLLYNVAGIYTNTGYMSVSVDSTGVSFDKIQAEDFDARSYSQNRDAIGFDWKVPIFKGTDVTYRTRDYVSYYVRKKQHGTSDQLYKIRFLDFYDDKGVKGTPAFEVKRLR